MNTKNFRPATATDKPNNLSKTFFNTGNSFYKTSNKYITNNNNTFNINDAENDNNIGRGVFIGDKTKTANFFKNTRVDSCSHVVEIKGRTFAVPYSVVNSRARPLSSFKINQYKKPQERSIYATDYTNKVIMHAGMGKKPLVPYHPISYRNRLPTSDFYMPYKNTSKFDLGEKTDINRKQWVSTQKDSYQWPVPTPVTNSGILASTFKESHRKLVSHN